MRASIATSLARRALPLACALLTAAPVVARAQSEPVGFVGGQLALSLDSTPAEIAGVGVGFEVAKFLTPLWSVGFELEALKDSSPRGIVESEQFLGFSLLFTRHKPVTDRVAVEASAGIGGLRDTADFPAVRVVEQNATFRFGFAVPIRAARRLNIVPQLRIVVAPKSLNGLVMVRVGVRRAF